MNAASNGGKILLNTVIWGLVLWLFGYALAFVFFIFVPKDMIGWFILPLGVAATLLVLTKKIRRASFGHYVGLGVAWAIMAVVLDYLFIVRLLKADEYYKFDVYLYYFLTLVLPIAVGRYAFRARKERASTGVLGRRQDSDTGHGPT